MSRTKRTSGTSALSTVTSSFAFWPPTLTDRFYGIYYFVPGVFAHFDTEAIHALIAPRPHLELSGDQDQGAPTDGVVMLEKKLGQVYRLYGKESNFKSIIYEKTGHEYLPEMREEMVRWFEKTLPVK